MELKLPETVTEIRDTDPGTLLIFSHPKAGKTTLLQGLPNCLIIDLEAGSKFITGKKIQINTIQELSDLAKLIKEKNDEIGGYFYDYIAIDTVTELETLVLPLALKLYNRTAMGKGYKGDILALPNGAGYKYLRDAFEIVWKKFVGLSRCLILLGHIKTRSINKLGKELEIRDIALTGKIATGTAAAMDANGYLYRKGNQSIVSFKRPEVDTVTGARPPHMEDRDIVVAERQEDGTYVYHWEEIFRFLADSNS